MKGDFSTISFDPSKHFSSVLLQQGRVLLDSDFNQQAAIVAHYFRTLARVLIGPHGGPGDDFAITVSDNVLQLNRGCYYVEGLLCENYPTTEGLAESPLPLTELSEALPLGEHQIYLDAWEQHVTWNEEPAIKEVALGVADTTTRVKVMWRVAATSRARDLALGPEEAPKRTLLPSLTPELWAGPSESFGPCSIPPDAKYRGFENQLYRIEIHDGGNQDEATFKWSRDNGSVTFPVTNALADADSISVQVTHLGRDDRFTLNAGDWVEFVDDVSVLQSAPNPLLEVVHVGRGELEVMLRKNGTPFSFDAALHPFLRRWDRTPPRPSDTPQVPRPLSPGEPQYVEDGIQVTFSAGDYRSGDYWLVPARTATRDLLWPRDAAGQFVAVAARTLEHHYAPLAFVKKEPTGALSPDTAYVPRNRIEPLGKRVP